MSKSVARFEVHRPSKESTGDKIDEGLTQRDESLRDCRVCKSEHAIRKCPKFRKMSVGERWKVVTKHRYCFNCLAHSHLKDKCTSRDRCMECLAEHHTLLHRFRGSKNRPRTDVHEATRAENPKPRKHKKANRKTHKRNCPKDNQNPEHLQLKIQHLQQQLEQLQQQSQQGQPRAQQPHQLQPHAATIVINVQNGRLN